MSAGDAPGREELAAALYEVHDHTDEQLGQYVPWSTLPDNERFGWLEQADDVRALYELGYSISKAGTRWEAGKLTTDHIGMAVRFMWLDPSRPRLEVILAGELAGIRHGYHGEGRGTELDLVIEGHGAGARVERFLCPSAQLVEVF